MVVEAETAMKMVMALMVYIVTLLVSTPRSLVE